MNTHAVFHISDIPYAYGIDRETLFVKLRVANGDLKSCEILYKDRYDWSNPYLVKKMELAEVTEIFDFYEVNIKVHEKRFRYIFKLEDKMGNTKYFNERGFVSELSAPIEEGGFQFAYLNGADVYQDKDILWAQEGIIYQIMPDRFCNGDTNNKSKGTLPWGDKPTWNSMFGGDIQGIINKIPYLYELGITILYMTPIFTSTSNHKYNTKNYYKIDKGFGDIEKTRELIKKCHELGIKVIFDCVFNHTGDDFFAFKDLIKKGEKSKYKDWFFIDKYPVDINNVNYETFANKIADLPKLNTENQEVKKYLLKIAKFWLMEVDIDGFRLDACDEVDHNFWREFRKVVKTVKPEAIIVGEVMHDALPWLRGDQLDSIMNYPIKNILVEFFGKRVTSVESFDNQLSLNRTKYMKKINKNMWNLIGSHDTARFLTEAKGCIERLKLAFALQTTYIGVPYIYYGDEVGMTGGTDPYCRGCMVWESDKQNIELLEFYKKMNRIRKSEKVLVHGDILIIHVKQGVIAFKRKLNQEEIIVMLNNSDDDYNMPLDSLEEIYFDLIDDKEIILKDTFKLSPNDIKILKKKN